MTEKPSENEVFPDGEFIMAHFDLRSPYLSIRRSLRAWDGFYAGVRQVIPLALSFAAFSVEHYRQYSRGRDRQQEPQRQLRSRLWLRQNGQRSRIGGDAVPKLICDHAAHGQTVLFKLNRFDAVGILIGARDVRPLISTGHTLPTVAVGLFASNRRHGEYCILTLGRSDAYGLIDNAQLHGKQQTHMVI